MASAVAAPAGDMAGDDAKPVGTRVARLGLLFIAAVPIIFIIAGLLAGQDLGENVPFFAAVIAFGLVGAVLVSRFGTAGRIGGIVASLLGFGAMFWATFGLFAPQAIADFVPGMLMPLGFLMGLIGSIVAIVKARKGRVSVGPSSGERKVMSTVLAVVAIGTVASAALTFTGKTTVDAAAAQGATPIGYESFKFDTAEYRVSAGDVKMVVHNGDAFVHDFAVPDLGVEPAIVNPGSDALVEFTAEPGTYTMLCTLHSDPKDPQAEGNMAATLIVE